MRVRIVGIVIALIGVFLPIFSGFSDIAGGCFFSLGSFWPWSVITGEGAQHGEKDRDISGGGLRVESRQRQPAAGLGAHRQHGGRRGAYRDVLVAVAGADESKTG